MYKIGDRLIKRLKAYKFRIYPNEEPNFLVKLLLIFVLLTILLKVDEESKGKIKYATPAKHKKEYEFLKEVDR